MNCKVEYYENLPTGRLDFSEESFRLCYCQRGKLIHNLNAVSAKLIHGDLFVLPPEKIPELYVEMPQTVFYVITFNKELFSNISAAYPLLSSFLDSLSSVDKQRTKVSLPPEEIVFFETVLSKIRYEESDAQTLNICVLSLLSSLSDIFTSLSLERISERYTKESFIKYCVLYIDAHCTEQISLEEITKLSATSRAQFCKLFKRETGLSFKDYLNRKRIQRAMALLKNGEKVTEAAYACGYLEFSTFYRNFKKFTDENPASYLVKSEKCSQM